MMTFVTIPRFRQVFLCVVGLSCADSPRENIVDPVVAPTIEMSAPEFTGGVILIQWRYLNEDPELSAFRVDRVSRDVTTEVGRVSAALAGDWRAETLVDSTLVAGVEVTYRVTGILNGGSATTTASGSITVEGTQFEVTVDVDRLLIGLSWSRAPEETRGFRVYRGLTDSNEPMELIFETQDADVRTFEDTDLTGNLEYLYELETVLGNNWIRSAPTAAKLFGLLESPQTDAGKQFGVRTLIARSEVLAFPNRIIAFLVNDTATSIVTVHGTRIEPEESRDLDFTDFSPHSLSILGGTREHWSNTPRFTSIYGGLNAAETQAFLVVKDVRATHVLKTWPSSGGSRTGVSEFGGDVLMFEGSTLRSFDREFEDRGEPVTIEMGAPIDMDYLDGSIWLAYPDRLYRSNPVTSLEMLTSWEEVSIPIDIVVTAIANFNGKFALLDAANSRLHLLSLEGEALLSWDALGENLENGDVGTNGAHTLLYQSEPLAGRVHVFDPESRGVTGGPAGNPGFF